MRIDRSALLALLLISSSVALAQSSPQGGGGDSHSELAKKAQNPLSAMISVPLQYNAYFGSGAEQRTLHLLNVQPVVPVRLSERWGVIARTIVPFSSVPVPVGERQGGLGDITLQPFLSPTSKGAFTWGLGPALVLPTATDALLGAGKWSAGPAAIGVVEAGPWVLGALAQNVWSFAGDDARPGVNALTLQPFLNFNLPEGWAVGTSPILTADWNATAGERWTVPLGGTVSKALKAGPQAMNLTAGVFYNAIRPDLGPSWQGRFSVALLYPRKG